MALIALGASTRAQAMCQRYQFTDDAFAETWLRGLDTFFVGMTLDDMELLISTVRRYVHHTTSAGSMRANLAFCVDRLQEGQLVLLDLGSLAHSHGHWVLGVGHEELVDDGRCKVISLLCLDAAQPAPPLLRFNSRVELDVPHFGARYVRYRTASGDARSVTISSAIALEYQELPTARALDPEAVR